MIPSSTLLAAISKELREPLLANFSEISKNFTEGRWEPAELDGGKFCECVYSVLHGTLTGNYATAPWKPQNMFQACVALEQLTHNPPLIGDRSLRILIPRMLLPLYEIRNNRGVGHVGADVNPNYMDAISVLAMTSWVLAELIRVFHNVPIQEAQAIVDALVERKNPMIWKVEDKKRVLDPSMNKNDQVLALLYSEATWVSESKLFDWVEYSSIFLFRARILKPLHKARFIEYDFTQERAKLSPRGVSEVEQRILKNSQIQI